MRGEDGRPVEHAGDRPGNGFGAHVDVCQRSDGAEQAGVVDPEIDTAESSDDGVGEAGERVAVGHVDGRQDGDVAALGRGPRAGDELRRVTSAQAEVQARRREVDGETGAEPAAGAGDDRDPAGDGGRRRHRWTVAVALVASW